MNQPGYDPSTGYCCSNTFPGHFAWGGENFAYSAKDIELHREGEEEVPVLRANLVNIEREEIPGDINLGERIVNEDGELVFKGEDD